MNPSPGSYDQYLCNERHKHIEKRLENLDMDIKKVANRFLVLVTMLSMNLLGIAFACLLLLQKT